MFPLTNLPAVLSVATKIDPLSYGVDGLRGALIATAHFGIGADLAVLGATAVVFLAIGAYSFSRIQI